MPTNWKPGDRVYATQEHSLAGRSWYLTGTVTDLAGCGDLRARVAWDDGGSDWLPYSALDWYTLPAVVA